MAAPINLNPATQVPLVPIRTSNKTSTNIAITLLALSTISLIIGILVLLASKGIVDITAFKIGMTGGIAITAIAGVIWLPAVIRCFQVLNSYRYTSVKRKLEEWCAEDPRETNRVTTLAPGETTRYTSVKRKLEEWCAKAPGETNRVTALNTILNVVRSNGRMLSLSSLQLTSLPDIFDQLPNCAILFAENNHLSGLPPSLARSNLRELHIANNRFRVLTSWIGNMQLELLDISNNRDIILPKTLPIPLRSLYFSNNNFNALPQQIRTLTNLTSLDFSNNRIRALPNWIENLSHLESISGSHNQMRCLPNALRRLTRLRAINVSHNLINTIPISMITLRDLQTFDISDNRLTSIPVDLVALGHRGNVCTIHAERNRLTSEAIMRFERAIQEHDWSYLRFHATVYEPIYPIRNLDPPPQRHGDAPTSQPRDILFWEEQAAQTERRKPRDASFFESLTEDPNAEALHLFLTKIPNTEDYRNDRTRNHLIGRLMHILEGAVTNPIFREKFFILLQDASESCGDRVATAFVRIEGYYSVYCADHPLSLTELRNVIVGMRKIELVTQHAQALAKKLNAGDEMEIILFCLLRLKKRLDLPTSIQGMLYEGMAYGVTQSHLNEIAIEVMRETNHIYHQLIQSEIWSERILADNQAEFQAKKDSIISAFEELEKKNEAGEIESEAYLITEMNCLQKQFDQLEVDFIGLKTRESLSTLQLQKLIEAMKRAELVTHYAQELAKKLGQTDNNQTQFIQFFLSKLKKEFDLPPSQEMLSKRQPPGVTLSHLEEIRSIVIKESQNFDLSDSTFWKERYDPSKSRSHRLRKTKI